MRWRIRDCKASSGCADQRFVVHQLKSLLKQLKSLCWIFYSQLRSLLLELLPSAQSLCWSIAAHGPAHKSRFHLLSWWSIFQNDWFLERWELSTCYPVESRREPLPRNPPKFSRRTPTHAIWWRQKRNSNMGCVYCVLSLYSNKVI